MCKCSFITKNKKKQYCSKKCLGIHITNRLTGHKPFNYKGGILKHKGYILILSKNHPFGDRDGYVYQHRLVMEEKIGRFLEKKEVVHHINGIRHDNRIQNLELKQSQADHMREHYPKGVHIYKDKHPLLGKKHKESSKQKMKVTKANNKLNQ